jgi:nitrilase
MTRSPENAIVAAVQATPVFLDRDATTERACALIKDAAAGGASMVAFPEAFIPTYPDWVARGASWSDDDRALTARLYDQAVTVGDETTRRLGEAAADSGTYVVMGVNERDGGTLYNTLLYFAPSGELVNRHRKLMPTGGERTIWGMGDGSTLDVVRTPFGTVGGLICWENYMPLARAAMYARGLDIYLAPTWDNGPRWIATLQHIAKEGRCYVLGISSVQAGSDVPAELRLSTYRDDPDDWMNDGWTCIVAPGGSIVAGPVKAEEDILFVEIDHALIAEHRRYFDPVGHYDRPDVFRLSVDTTPRSSVEFG